MSQEPPSFQEASRCDVCKCSFSTFRRRHHCRCCGRTLCAEHSSNQMPLPQFGVNSAVRVCADCFNDASRSVKAGSASINGIDIITDSVSRFDIGTVSDFPKPVTGQIPISGVQECKCGMPLCICQAPAPSKDASTLKSNSSLTSSVALNPKPKKADTAVKSRGSTSSSSAVSNQGTNSGLGTLQINYEVNGEGLREAIKKGETAAVKWLLSQGVDPNYCDKQGLSLLHVAAVFNQTDIAFALIESGARLDCKNFQGETPLDCAPATLQYKMKKKIEESEELEHAI